MPTENFRTVFDSLDQPEAAAVEIRPLRPEDIDLPLIRQRLAEGGVNLNLSESERGSLAKKKFLTLHEDRGIGVTAALGKPKAIEFLNLSYQLMNRRRSLAEGNDKSASRGMHQIVADLIQIAVEPEPTAELIERFCTRTNQRVKAGYNSKTLPPEFKSVPEPENAITSVPPDSIPVIWQFLTTPPNKVE